VKEWLQHNTTFVALNSYNNTSITLKLLVRIKWIKYTLKCILLVICILWIWLLSVFPWNKPTCMSILPMLMCLWCGCAYMNQNSGSIKGPSKCECFTSICWLTVNSEVPDCSLVNMWHCASASAARIRHKPWERSEMNIRMFKNNFHCWTIRPSGM